MLPRVSKQMWSKSIPPMPSESELEVERLRRELAALKSAAGGGLAGSIEGLNVLALRVGADGRTTYVNSELARLFNAGKAELVGRPLEEISRLFGGGVQAVLQGRQPLPEEGPAVAKDAHERSFEIRVHRRGEAGGVRDIVLHDVTDEQRMRAYARKYFPADFSKLSDGDLRSFKFPERRFMSVGFTDLRGFTALSETLSPEEVRALVNAYMEEVAQAIQAAGGTVDKFVGDEVMALFGAPLYHRDHAFRAVACACEQVARVEALRRQFEKAGKALPPCGIGLNAGDMVLGNMGSSTRQNYTVLGPAVNLASRLCGAAPGGQVLLSESFFRQVMRQMPSGWVATHRTERLPLPESESSASDSGGKVERLEPLPASLDGRVTGIGPEGEPPVYVFRYRYALEVKGVSAPIVTLSVEQPRTGVAAPLEAQASEPERSERLLGRYRLDRPIGRGGMGEVWRARDQFGNRVAVKTLLSGEAATEGQIRRFQREAQIMSRLQHRNLCRVFEVGEWERQHYIAMELVDGVSLRDLMRRPEAGSVAVSSLAEAVRESRSASSGPGGDESRAEISALVREVKSAITHTTAAGSPSDGLIPVSPSGVVETPADQTYQGRVFPRQQALSLVHQIGEGVQAAHEAGVLHRDLKPANILLRENGEPVVMDFGLAKLHREDGGELSLTGQVLGTIEYMAPEQARSSRELDERADVFSLGAILFELLTGRKCLQATGNLLADSRRLEEFEPERASKYNRRIDSDLDAILLKALAPDPARRYRSILALLSDIEAYQAGRVISAKTPSSIEILWKLIRRNAAVSSTVATALALLLAGAVYAFYWINRERDIAALQREAAEARNLLRHEPARSLADVRRATERSLGNLGAVLPSVQFALGEVMIKAPQVWRTYLGPEPVTALAVLPASEDRPMYVAAIHEEKLNWLDQYGQPVGEPVELDGAGGGIRLSFLGTVEHSAGVAIRARNGHWFSSGPGQTLRPLLGTEFSDPRVEALKAKGSSWALNQRSPLATGQANGTVKVWRLEKDGSFSEPVIIRGHTDAVTAVAWSGDDQLATGSRDRTVRITGPEGQYLGDPIQGHEGAIMALAWADDGMTLYSAGSDGTVRRWDVSQFQTRPPQEIEPGPVPTQSVRVTSPDGDWVAEADGSSVVRLYPKGQPGEARELYGHWMPVCALAFSPDGRTLATGGKDHAVMLWNRDGDLISPPILIHLAPVVGLAFTPDGRKVITQSTDGTSREFLATPEGWLERLRGREALESAASQDQP
ncbi:MAG: protein kinase [Verrucomicrobiota bacterium]